MGGSSRSSTSSQQATNTQNLNLQEIDGIAVAGVSGNVAIQSTDQGTVEAARDIAIASLDTGAAGFQETIDLADSVIAGGQSLSRDVLDAGVRVGEGALDLAGDAFASAERQGETYAGFVRDTAGEALDFASDSQARSFDAVSMASQGFNETVGGLTEDFIQGGQDLLSQVIDFIGGAGNQIIEQTAAIQARESGNTDARLQDITRVALIGGAVVAGLAIWAAAAK